MNQKISLFSGIYSPETGGPAKFAQTFSEFAASKKHTIQVFAYSSLPLKINLNSFIELHLISNQISILKRFLYMIRNVITAAKSDNLILVNGCFWEVAIVRHFLNFKYVAKVPGDIVWERLRNRGKTAHTIETFQKESFGINAKIMRYLFSYSLRKAEWVIVPSQHLGILCQSWGINKSRIVLINNSVAIPEEQKDLAKQHEYDFVTVCRLVSWKGVNEIIECVSGLNASLLVVGDGPERATLEELSISTKANVTFVGEVPPQNVSQYLSRCSVFILNSNFEATSYALLEAQAQGLITIGNENTGSEEVITHQKTGLLCGVKSGINLEKAMKMALVNNEQNRKMRLASRLAIEQNFNSEINYKKILDLCLK